MSRLVLAASLVFSLSALAVAFFARPEPAPVVPVSPPTPAPASDAATLAALEGRVGALEAELDVLRSQLRGVSGTGAAPAIAQQVAQLREDVAAMQVGGGAAAGSSREVVKDLVKEAEADLNRERQQARVEQLAKAQQAQQQASAERWKRFTSEANLTWQQEQTLTQRLAAESAKRDELMGRLRDGSMSMGELRGALAKERALTDDAMAQALSTEQKTKYDAARAEENRGGRGPRGGSMRGGTGDGPRPEGGRFGNRRQQQ